MAIRDVGLKNFRSYGDFTVELSDAVNIVVGPNASGKTNLLEAILVLAQGSSYRARDADLIHFGRQWTRLEAHAGDHARIVQIKQGEAQPEKKITIDGTTLRRLSHERMLPITLFEPEHLRLLTGSPELRREYLDGILRQTIVGFRTTSRRYRRALAQRNALLKHERALNKDELFVWDVRLAELGKTIHEARMKLVSELNKQTSKIYSELSGTKASLRIRYQPSISDKDYGSALLKALNARLATDSERGFTSVGPHREDFKVLLNRKDAAIAASRGETRTIILAFKLIELLLVEKQREQKPILLLDDVFSELDGSRRRALTEYLKNYQTIITTTDADAIVKHFMSGYHVIPTSYG